MGRNPGQDKNASNRHDTPGKKSPAQVLQTAWTTYLPLISCNFYKTIYMVTPNKKQKYSLRPIEIIIGCSMAYIVLIF